MRKATEARLIKLGKQYEAKIGYWAGALVSNAKPGYVWSCSGDIHELVADLSGQSEEEAAKDLIDRMNYGIEKCQDVDCDWCNDDDGDGGYEEMRGVIYDPEVAKP